MKLSVPAPVTIFEKPFSLLDMARYVTGKERRYNRTAEDARGGARLVAAIAAASNGSAEVLEPDLRKAAEVFESPSCGWGVHQISIPIPDSKTGGTRVITRSAHASTADYLPLIDAISEAAKRLPPLPATPA